MIVVLDIYSIIPFIIYTSFVLLSILNVSFFGDANFNGLKMVGPYQVGHKEFHTSINGLAVSVYYPMDRREYKRTIHLRGRNTKWLRYGESSVKGMT